MQHAAVTQVECSDAIRCAVHGGASNRAQRRNPQMCNIILQICVASGMCRGHVRYDGNAGEPEPLQRPNGLKWKLFAIGGVFVAALLTHLPSVAGASGSESLMNFLACITSLPSDAAVSVDTHSNIVIQNKAPAAPYSIALSADGVGLYSAAPAPLFIVRDAHPHSPMPISFGKANWVLHALPEGSFFDTNAPLLVGGASPNRRRSAPRQPPVHVGAPAGWKQEADDSALVVKLGRQYRIHGVMLEGRELRDVYDLVYRADAQRPWLYNDAIQINVMSSASDTTGAVLYHDFGAFTASELQLRPCSVGHGQQCTSPGCVRIEILATPIVHD